MSKVVVHVTGSSLHNLLEAVGPQLTRAGERLLNDLELTYATSDRHCVMCGCTDNRACHAGCRWVLKFPASFTGVCSKCWGKFESQVLQVDTEEIET